MNSKQRRKAFRTSTEFLPKIKNIIKNHIKEWEKTEVTKEQILNEFKKCLEL